MAISTNSIFHFTSSQDALKAILSEGAFKITYCLESYVLENSAFKMGVAMVSFCDIPLANVSNHINSYGRYAIGLSKSWAERFGLNPVMYISRNSSCSNALVPFFKHVLDKYENLGSRYELLPTEDGNVSMSYIHEGERQILTEVTLSLLAYIKNEKGKLWRKGNLVDKTYKFYDEREWRYVPTLDDFSGKGFSYEPIITEDSYKEWRQSNNSKPFFEKMELPFAASDIDYIIVGEEKELNELIEFTKRQKHLFKSQEDLNLLISRYYSVEKIQSDI